MVRFFCVLKLATEALEVTNCNDKLMKKLHIVG